MNQIDMYEIVRRWHDGQTVSSIAKTENRDRKTIREVVRKAQDAGVTRGSPLPDKDILCTVFEDWHKKKERVKRSYDEFVKHEEEIRLAIKGNDDVEGMKPKTAYLCMRDKHGLEGSYETFKRFARDRGFGRIKNKPMLRIEMEPGKEVQIDYGRMGLMLDVHTGKKRVVNGFVMVLSHSRFPFIQFTYTQQAHEFAGSIRDAFEFFGGVPERISLDNLKSGVLKPDLYDPKLNRTFQELVEHYDTFADPCRIANPTDKGKVERQMPVARELYKYLRYLHPSSPLPELNQLALDWCLHTYGMRLHGTTRLKPKEIFETVEKTALKRLPEDRFETAEWKKAKVHLDQFLQFDYKLYSMPYEYVGKELWMRKCGKMMGIYNDFKKIREYVIPHGRTAHVPGDFPEGKEEMMQGRYPSYILSEAMSLGETAGALMKRILEPHAYIKSRRGRGILTVMQKYKNEMFFERICRIACEQNVCIPKNFEQMMKKEAEQMEEIAELIPLSEEGMAMTRDPNYYIQEAKDYETTASLRNGSKEIETFWHGSES
jgi:transposase